MVRITKVLGLRRPPPLCWEKLPNNPVFSLSSAPLEVHLSSKMNTFARLNDNINNFWVFWLVMADFWWVFWWKSQWLKIAYTMKRSITFQVAYFAIWNCQWTLVLTLSFTPFEHSGRVTHADKGRSPIPNRLFFLTLFKRPLTPPSFWTFMLRIFLSTIAKKPQCTKSLGPNQPQNLKWDIVSDTRDHHF